MSAATNSPPLPREFVFCHECHDEWYRDEHGLVCPNEQCRSDFVEIIENNGSSASDRGLRRHREFFGAEDDDGDIRGHTYVHFEGPNIRLAMTRSSLSMPGRRLGGIGSRTPGPGGERRDRERSPSDIESSEEFLMVFTNMLRNTLGDQRMPTPAQQRAAMAGEEGEGGGGEGHAHDHIHSYSRSSGEDGPGGERRNSRRIIQSSFSLGPRYADSPQPRGDAQAVDLSHYLASILSSSNTEFGPLFPPGILGLGRMMGMSGGPGGDYVYSETELARVISQLMEQNQGNAPPPAQRETIDSLPKIKVTEAMARDGGECAVCKEELLIEEEVAQLPCNHVYHFECVSKWLEVHDTCPICRKPCTPDEQGRQSSSRQSSSQSQTQTQSSSSTTTSSLPWPLSSLVTAASENIMPPSNNSSNNSSNPSNSDRGSGGSSGNASSGNRSSGSFANLFRRGNS
ncbi:hypothetical protein RUND412_007450 [Rhizina undulata]